MNIANIVVNQTTGVCTMRKRIPAGAVGLTVTVHFADPLWDRLEKTVVFRGRELEKIADRFDGTTAVIPAEVIAEPDTVLYFGIWGHEPEGILQLPLIEVRLGTTERATQPGSDPEADPDLPIWAQLQEDIDDLRELVESGTGTGGGLVIDSDGEGNVSIRAAVSTTITSDGAGNVTIGEVHEMKTLTLAGEEFNSFQDQQAREELLKKLPNPEAAAKVGQHLRVQSVDEAGNITGLEPVDANQDSGGNVDFQVDETLSLKDGVLSVNTTNDMEQDNTLPITSAGVFATVGNIEALLKTI